MTQKFKQIQIANLDKRFKKIHFEPRPNRGWIKTIRTALSMPLAFLAFKLNISKQAVAKLENGEIDETISLKSLRRLAEAMDCKLCYAIIPHDKSLQKIIEKRADKIAKIIVAEVDKTMALENQKITNSQNSVKILAKELAENLTKKLWSLDENN